jgi:hypothetical protein
MEKAATIEGAAQKLSAFNSPEPSPFAERDLYTEAPALIRPPIAQFVPHPVNPNQLLSPPTSSSFHPVPVPSNEPCFLRVLPHFPGTPRSKNRDLSLFQNPGRSIPISESKTNPCRAAQLLTFSARAHTKLETSSPSKFRGLTVQFSRPENSRDRPRSLTKSDA